MEITRDKTYKLDFTNTDILRNERYGNYLVELQGDSYLRIRHVDSDQPFYLRFKEGVKVREILEAIEVR